MKNFLMVICLLLTARVSASSCGDKNTLLEEIYTNLVTVVQSKDVAKLKCMGQAEGSSALILASLVGSGEFLQELIDSGEDVSAKGPKNVTAIFTAAIGANHEGIKVLLENGADACATADEVPPIFSPIMIIDHLENGGELEGRESDEQIVRYIAQNKTFTDFVKTYDILFEAMEKKCPAELKDLLEDIEDIEDL